jgi:hypothetical protein
VDCVGLRPLVQRHSPKRHHVVAASPLEAERYPNWRGAVVGRESLPEGSRGAREQDAHPWAENNQAQMVRGLDGRGASAIIEQRQQFVREYSAFRVMTRPAWPMGRWSVPGIGDQPEAHLNAPGLRQRSEGLENPPNTQAARLDLILTSEIMALVRDAVSGVTALPGSSTAPSVDPRVGDPKIWHTERVGTTEDPPVRELSPVGPSGSADRVPHDEEAEEILATGYVPLRWSPFRSAPVPVSGEIPASLLEKLRSSGVFHWWSTTPGGITRSTTPTRVHRSVRRR